MPCAHNVYMSLKNKSNICIPGMYLPVLCMWILVNITLFKSY